MATGRQLKRQDLFVVRFWAEESDDGATGWSGKVQRAVSGEEGSFRNFPELVTLLSEMLSDHGYERQRRSEATTIGDQGPGTESRGVSPVADP